MSIDSIRLKDGRELGVEVLTYPIEPGQQVRIIDLIQVEWPRTDVDWLQSMRGCYADVLTIQTALGSLSGEAVATASVAHPKKDPEAGIVMDVVTAPGARRLGVARTITDALVSRAFAAGCRVVHLGNMPMGPSVYETIGFERLGGVFMRRPAIVGSEPEKDFFATGQRTSIRGANWGDLPGVVCLHAQPLNCALLNHRIGLVSRKFHSPSKAVGSFTTVWQDVESAQGVMLALIGETEHRVLGYGTLVPGPRPAQDYRAQIDICLHDAYARHGREMVALLIQKGRKGDIEVFEAGLAETDSAKLKWFTANGFRSVARLQDRLHLRDRSVDILLLEQRA